jgi:hypothetical protein
MMTGARRDDALHTDKRKNARAERRIRRFQPL